MFTDNLNDNLSDNLSDNLTDNIMLELRDAKKVPETRFNDQGCPDYRP
jgi:hypothetical protein